MLGLKMPRSTTNPITQQCPNRAPPSGQPKPTPPHPRCQYSGFQKYMYVYIYINHKTEGFRLNRTGGKNLTYDNCTFNLSMSNQISGNCIFASDVAKAKFARPRPQTSRPGTTFCHPRSSKPRCVLEDYISLSFADCTEW